MARTPQWRDFQWHLSCRIDDAIDCSNTGLSDNQLRTMFGATHFRNGQMVRDGKLPEAIVNKLDTCLRSVNLEAVARECNYQGTLDWEGIHGTINIYPPDNGDWRFIFIDSRVSVDDEAAFMAALQMRSMAIK